MICFLLCRAGDHTIRDSYLFTFPGIADRVRVATYESMLRTRRIPAGCYVFTDLERVGRRLRPSVESLYEQFASLEPLIRLVNDPRRVLARYDMLRRFYERGINDFEVFRVIEARRPTRWPVFLRREDNHDGPIGDLLSDQIALDRAIGAAVADGHPRERLLIVEFCDTSDDRGVTIKYGAYCVDGIVVPRHVMIRPHWIIKHPTFEETAPFVSIDDQIRREVSYVAENPHADQVRKAFEIANIGYGRIDYGIKDGRIRVWEINTNPVIATPSRLDGGVRHRTVVDPAIRGLTEAILRLDSRFPASHVPIDLSPRRQSPPRTERREP